MKRSLIVFLVALVAVSTLTPASAVTRSKISLSIKADLADGAGLRGWTLSCEPQKGNHPNAKAACALLKKTGKALFAPVPKNAACTMIYGGDERVTVNGILGGKRISAVFTRANGCEIARYDRAAALFTIPNTQVLRGSVTLDQKEVAAPVIFVSDSRQATTTATELGFIIRLGFGTWLGSAGVGVSCTPVTVTVPGADQSLLISCTSQNS